MDIAGFNTNDCFKTRIHTPQTAHQSCAIDMCVAMHRAPGKRQVAIGQDPVQHQPIMGNQMVETGNASELSRSENGGLLKYGVVEPRVVPKASAAEIGGFSEFCGPEPA